MRFCFSDSFVDDWAWQGAHCLVCIEDPELLGLFLDKLKTIASDSTPTMTAASMGPTQYAQ